MVKCAILCVPKLVLIVFCLVSRYCANSYERGGARNLPAAALAYKCAAVAHMRVLMAKNLSFTRDQQQLHASVQATSLAVNQTPEVGAMNAAPAYPGTENAPLPAGNGVGNEHVLINLWTFACKRF